MVIKGENQEEDRSDRSKRHHDGQHDQQEGISERSKRHHDGQHEYKIKVRVPLNVFKLITSVLTINIKEHMAFWFCSAGQSKIRILSAHIEEHCNDEYIFSTINIKA